MSEKLATKNPFNIIVIVAALGYFVDIYDLILFGIVKDPSLKDIGITDPQMIIDQGATLLGIQMIGMLIGGMIWGILGDKLGRLSTLFLTILIYSASTFANGFIHDFNQYAVLRFISGIGLAGELGVGITLVSEVMTKEHRGYGTALVSGVGIAGAVLGYLVTKYFGWREAYYVGGGLGLALLILRVSVYESGMFKKMKEEKVKRGSFISLFTNKKRFFKYLNSIMIGIPVWYVIGILVIFSPQLGEKVFNIQGVIIGGAAIMYHYIGASIGSIVTGLISQWLKSRKKALLIALSVLTVFIAIYFSMFNASVTFFYTVLFLLGIAQGYWAVFVTSASEQFGTNLRSTVTTTAPNFVRGLTFLMAIAFKRMGKIEAIGLWNSALIIGVVVMVLAFIALYNLEETYGKDLDYFEEI